MDAQRDVVFAVRVGTPHGSPKTSMVSVELAGELDAASCDDCFLRCVTAGAHHVVVGMGGLTFMDASGYRSLEQARAHLERLGGSLVWQGAGGEPARFLELVAARDRPPQPA